MSLTLTPSAVDYFKRYLQGMPSESVMVFSVSHSGCSGLKYQTDAREKSELSDDFLACEQDGWVYFVARDALTYLEGMRVDCRKQSLGQEKIVYDHPKAKNVCGCGISFNLDQDAD